MTVSAIEHRFRPLKKHAQAVREAVVKGKDARSMAEVIGAGGKGTPGCHAIPVSFAVSSPRSKLLVDRTELLFGDRCHTTRR